jgi:hypothetical protein
MPSGRRGWAVRLFGVGCAVLLAAVGATAYLIVSGVGRDGPLPTRVLGTQAITLASPGPNGASAWGGTGPAPGTLQTSGNHLAYSPGAAPGAQWTADQMQGGTYIFIYLDGGECLTSPPPPASAAVLESCNLQASQRWVRQALTAGEGGLDYWQLRNGADSRCLGAAGPSGQSVQMQPCQPLPDWHQLVAYIEPGN